MKPKTRNILIVLGVFAAILIGLVGFGMYSIYSFVSRIAAGRELPPELIEARITKGAGLLRRSEFFKLDESGWMETIKETSKTQDEKEQHRIMNARTARSVHNFSDLRVVGDTVVAVAEFGGFFFDFNGNLKNEITFEPTTARVKIGPIESDTYQPSTDNISIVLLDREHIGFLSHGYVQGARVFDHDGNEIWSTGKEILDVGGLLEEHQGRSDASKPVWEAAVGDLDNDGVSEYIVARSNDGIRAYDRAGKERWFVPNEAPTRKLVVFDLNGDGENEFIEVGGSIRDKNGKVIREMDDRSGDAFLFVENKTEYEMRFADISERRLTYMDAKGQKLFDAELPLSEVKSVEPTRIDIAGEEGYTYDTERIAYPKAVLVRIQKDKPKYLAIVAGYIGLSRANFYLLDEKGTLVYHELLPEEAETIAALPSGDGVDDILIGGKNTIWRYAAN
jgi:hypothetical protein